MPKNSVRGEWYAAKENVNGIVKGNRGRTGWSIDFEKLARITNGHHEFIEKVKDFAEKDLRFVYNAAVYRSFSDPRRDTTTPKEHIAIVFDAVDTYIKILSCCVDHEQFPYVLEESLNKSYVWSIASML